MNLSEIVSDPQFTAKSPEQQQEFLQQNSPDFASRSPEVQTAIISRLRLRSQPETSALASTASPESKDENIIKRVAEDFGRRMKNTRDIYERSGESTLSKLWNAPRTATLTSGQAAGLLNDVMAETFVSAWNVLSPDEFKLFIKGQVGEFADTTLGKKAISALASGAEAYHNFSKAYPDAAKAVETVLNFSGVGLLNAAKREAIKTAGDLSTTATKMALRSTPSRMISSLPLKERLRASLRKNISEIVNLTGKGKSTPKQRIAYLDRAGEAVQEIVANKKNLSFTDVTGKVMRHNLPVEPKSAVWDMSQAIDQTKRSLWPEIEAGLKTPEIAGIRVATKKAIANIQDYIDSKSLSLLPGGERVRKVGEELIDNLKSIDTLSPTEAFDIAKKYRQELQGYFSSVVKPETDVTGLLAAAERGINENLREVISDSTIDSLRRYGNLLEIEDDFNKFVTTALTNQGIDYAATFSAMEMLKTATGHTFNPSALGTAHVISAIRKANRKVGKLISETFKETEKLMGEQAKLATKTRPIRQAAKTTAVATAAVPTVAVAQGTEAAAQPDFETRLSTFKQAVNAP